MPYNLNSRRQFMTLCAAGAASSALTSPAFSQSRGGVTRSFDPTLLTYEPIPQTRARFVTLEREVEDAQKNKTYPTRKYSWEELGQENIRKYLSNHSQWVSIDKADNNFEAGVQPFAKVKLAKGNYVIVIDYLRYMTESVYDNDALVGRYVMGVGLRTLCEVSVFQAGAEASLVALAASAQSNNVAGKIRFDAIGISSDDVSAMMPTTITLDESAVVQAASATAAIKTLMSDKSTTLMPYIIAIQYDKTYADDKRDKLLAAISKQNRS